MPRCPKNAVAQRKASECTRPVVCATGEPMWVPTSPVQDLREQRAAPAVDVTEAQDHGDALGAQRHQVGGDEGHGHPC
jgi:hypothetical protein